MMKGRESLKYTSHPQRSFNEMQTWITELRQLGPQNLVLAITGNKLDLESSRQVCTYVLYPGHH